MSSKIKPIPPLTQTLSDIREAFKDPVFLKALSGARLVGAVRASIDAGTCRIGRLIVHPQWQRRGIGTLLMDRIEASFPSAERFELFTGARSADNIRLYKKLGYTECRRADLSPKVRIVFLEKRGWPPPSV